MTSQATIEIKRLSSCSSEDALKAWNEGFRGYFVDMTLSLDGYRERLHRESITPEYSLVAFCDSRPAGFLLNGIRTTGGKKVAWNGGTGVGPEFRRRGVATALMRATIDLYRELGVEVATLEAISKNEGAIALYRQFGYEVVDRLLFLQHDGKMDSPALIYAGPDYTVEPLPLESVGQLSFYEHLAPWQAQWQSLLLNGGEALAVSDRDGVVVGYALFKKKLAAEGQPAGIVMYQCVVNPYCFSADFVVRPALRYVYAPLDIECRRSTHNLGSSSLTALRILSDCGFTPSIEQVQMVRTFPALIRKERRS